MARPTKTEVKHARSIRLEESIEAQIRFLATEQGEAVAVVHRDLLRRGLAEVLQGHSAPAG